MSLCPGVTEKKLTAHGHLKRFFCLFVWAETTEVTIFFSNLVLSWRTEAGIEMPLKELCTDLGITDLLLPSCDPLYSHLAKKGHYINSSTFPCHWCFHLEMDFPFPSFTRDQGTNYTPRNVFYFFHDIQNDSFFGLSSTEYFVNSIGRKIKISSFSTCSWIRE